MWVLNAENFISIRRVNKTMQNIIGHCLIARSRLFLMVKIIGQCILPNKIYLKKTWSSSILKWIIDCQPGIIPKRIFFQWMYAIIMSMRVEH